MSVLTKRDRSIVLQGAHDALSQLRKARFAAYGKDPVEPLPARKDSEEGALFAAWDLLVILTDEAKLVASLMESERSGHGFNVPHSASPTSALDFPSSNQRQRQATRFSFADEISAESDFHQGGSSTSPIFTPLQRHLERGMLSSRRKGSSPYLEASRLEASRFRREKANYTSKSENSRMLTKAGAVLLALVSVCAVLHALRPRWWEVTGRGLSLALALTPPPPPPPPPLPVASSSFGKIFHIMLLYVGAFFVGAALSLRSKKKMVAPDLQPTRKLQKLLQTN